MNRSTRHSVFRNIIEQQYNENSRYKLFRSVKGSQDWVQRLELLNQLPIHTGCVNCICWNETGTRLLSGSDDQRLNITDPYTYKTLTKYKTSHRANIFSAKFLPCTNDCGIVSCSGDGMILYTDLCRLEQTHNCIFSCHVGTTYEVATVPYDPNTFMSCGEDCTVRCYDLRMKEQCSKARCTEDIIISCQRAVTALTVNQRAPYQVAIGCSDSTVRLYDRRMLSPRDPPLEEITRPVSSYCAPGMEGRSFRITSLSFSPGGEDILVSYSSEQLYLFGLKENKSSTFSPDFEMPEIAEEPSSGADMATSVPVRRLRLRGDWSDTGPNARPQNESLANLSQARPTLHGTLMQRMTDVLSRMLNDPATRAALSHGGEDSLPENDDQSSQNDSLPQENLDLPSPGAPQSDSPVHVGILAVDISSLSADSQADPLEINDETGVRDSESTEEPLPSFSSTYSSYMNMSPSEPESDNQTCVAPDEEATPEEPPQSEGGDANAGSQLTELNDEFSTMCNGYMEKHGTEPVVNLVYSDKGPTVSTISFSADEPSCSGYTGNSSRDQMQVDCESSSTSNHNVSEGFSSPTHQRDNHDEAASSDDGSLDDSDDDGDRNFRGLSRTVHPIEKHMDEAIQNATKGADTNSSTRVRRSTLKRRYTGHRNARTMIKEATFWGNDYVISGSDCGHVFMWDRDTTNLTMLLQADHHVVNCVQPHPFMPILATSGIDYDVKLWAPIAEEPHFDTEMAEELMKRNAVMLEETKDTITVPATFMIRMLACLNQIRRGTLGGRSRLRRRDPSVSSE